MTDNKKKTRGLGRGLSALMADVSLDERPDAPQAEPMKAERSLPVETIEPNPDQPRRDFSEDSLRELAASIREKGIIQPLIVRANPRGKIAWEIVAGERRWRAAQLAKLHEVPVIVREFSDTEVLEVAIIENIQRADLNAVEEALGYRQLIDRFGHTQEQLAKALSKSRSHIANLMRLLNLPDDVQMLLRRNELSAGHARALITADNPSELAQIVVTKRLSVRETEALVKRMADPRPEKPRAPRREKDADTRALESDLSANLGLKVNIDHAEKGDGKLVINYRDLEDLDALCRLLSSSPLDVSR